MVDKVLRQV